MPGRMGPRAGKDGHAMAIRLRITGAVLTALIGATTVQAAATEETQAGSNGPNMPLSKEVVPSDIRPQDPPATGTMQKPGGSGERSHWHDIKRPPARPPGL
jgi:hypothetical protein